MVHTIDQLQDVKLCFHLYLSAITATSGGMKVTTMNNALSDLTISSQALNKQLSGT